MLRIDGMQRQAVDLFRTGDISLKNALHYGTIHLDKLEFVELISMLLLLTLTSILLRLVTLSHNHQHSLKQRKSLFQGLSLFLYEKFIFQTDKTI